MLDEEVEKLIARIKEIPGSRWGYTTRAYLKALQQAPELPRKLRDPEEQERFLLFLNRAKRRENNQALIYHLEDEKHSSYNTRIGVSGDPINFLKGQ